MADKFISFNDAINLFSQIMCSGCEFEGVLSGCETTGCQVKREIIEIVNKHPPADVVSRDCYDRILAENDTMREMLAQIGKKPGDKMDDVRSAVHGEWEHISFMTCRCSVCKEVFHELEGDNYCPKCVADMREATG